MIVRKNIGRAKSGLMLLMVLGFFFAAYNLVSMVVHNSGGYGLELFDPVIRMPEKVMGSTGSNSKYHVALTATDAAYSQWQCRIMYYWYNKVKDMPGSDMGKFTRILHSGRPDQLMDEIPTFVVDPLPEGLDRVRNFLRIRIPRSSNRKIHPKVQSGLSKKPIHHPRNTTCHTMLKAKIHRYISYKV